MFGAKKVIDKTYGIIGMGRFGTALAQSLAEAGKEIMILDYDEERVRDMRSYTENAFVVNKLDKKALQDAGIQNCDVVVVCIGESVDVSILTTLNVIDLGVPRVISKANTADQGKVLEKIGAEVVYPERDMGVRVAQKLISERLVNYFELRGNVNVSELSLTEALAGKTVEGINVRRNYGLNIIAVQRSNEIITDIMPEFMFQKDDIAIVIGNKEKIKQFEDSLGNN